MGGDEGSVLVVNYSYDHFPPSVSALLLTLNVASIKILFSRISEKYEIPKLFPQVVAKKLLGIFLI